MRSKPETVLITMMALFTAAGVTAAIIQDTGLGAHDPITDPFPNVEPGVNTAEPAYPDRPESGAAWLARVRGNCNPVDVDTRMRWEPAPETADGTMHEAACYALAGKVDEARSVIESLPESQQYEAAGVVFSVGHPAADAGDELAAGPLMELVVEYWPNHYMALYHAGAAAYERGDVVKAEDYLARFLEHYSVEDGWRRSAVSMLDGMHGC
ncbi:MAG: hypothetical protein AAF389_16165 [Gemmatimonadota bacterium]